VQSFRKLTKPIGCNHYKVMDGAHAVWIVVELWRRLGLTIQNGHHAETAA